MEGVVLGLGSDQIYHNSLNIRLVNFREKKCSCKKNQY